MQTSGPSTRTLIPRRAHKKSRRGCRTCKARKVKCDERRPLCVNCERRFDNLLACDFDDQEPITAQNAESRTVARVSGQRSAVGQAANTRRDAEPPALPQSVASGRIDPFEARPASEQHAPSVDTLVGHYLSIFAYRSFPLYANRSLIGTWWPFVRSDTLLFHISLLLSNLDRERLQARTLSICTKQLFGECIELLTQRIQDPVDGISDHTVAAIAAFAGIELGQGNMRALEVHLAGLKRVTDLRGGLDAIRATNPMVANFAFWCGMVSINEPTVLPLTYGDELDDSDWPGTTLLTHDGSEADLLEFGVDMVTANILHRVQRLSKLYATKVEFDTPEEAFTVLSSLCSVLDQMLTLSRAPSDDSPVPGLSQSCRLAGCLHLFAPQSGYFPDPTLMLRTLVHLIKASLGLVIRAVGTYSHLLLWLLSVGGITAHSMPPERAWFVGHLVVAITDLQIRTWEDMRQHLMQLAFHDNFCDIHFHALWEEVKRKQEALNMEYGTRGD